MFLVDVPGLLSDAPRLCHGDRISIRIPGESEVEYHAFVHG